MKVFDLKCAKNHVFEGWFASEVDFVAQCKMSLVQCPVCGDPSVVKQLSPDGHSKCSTYGQSNCSTPATVN